MIKRVFVYTYGNQSHANTMRVAVSFAEAHGAKITGLFVKPDMMGYASVYGTHPMNLARTFYDLQEDFAANAKKEFEASLDSADVVSEWHEVEEYENDPRPSAYADMIFVSQPDTESNVIFNDTDFVDHIILNNGLPVIVVPKSWEKTSLATRPVLAWKETKEAIGAVRHTLALMRTAEEVDVVNVVKTPNSETEVVRGIKIGEYLTDHGVTAKYFSETRLTEDSNEAAALLRHVENHANDLIIAGGYGHSRLRQIVLGGVTRSLIQNGSVPILLAH